MVLKIKTQLLRFLYICLLFRVISKTARSTLTGISLADSCCYRFNAVAGLRWQSYIDINDKLVSINSYLLKLFFGFYDNVFWYLSL